jgi:hypothetical protein
VLNKGGDGELLAQQPGTVLNTPNTNRALIKPASSHPLPSEALDVDYRFGKRSRGFLRQVVSDASRDDAMRIRS